MPSIVNRKRRRRLATIVAVATVAVLAAIPAEGTTQTFKPVADSYVTSAYPSTNYGGSTRLRVYASPTVRSYLRFNVQGTSGTVTRATLRLYSVDASTVGYEVRHVANNSWGENTITYSNAPAFSSTVTGTSGRFGASSWTNVDVTSLVKGNGTYSVILTTTSSTSARLVSRQGDRPPRLVVETSPSTDTSAPTTPSNVSVNAVDYHWVNVTWTAATDNVGVTRYTIYRNDAVIGSMSGNILRFSDTTVHASTTYTYRVDAVDAVGNRSGLSEQASISTPEYPSDPVIAAAGDIACDPGSTYYNGGLGDPAHCRQKYTADVVAAGGPLSAVLALGDTQYWCGGYKAFLQSYDPTWGRVKGVTRPVIGNHEYANAGGTDCTYFDGRGYFTYYGGAAGDPSKGYYSFNIGPWHLIALNSECSYVGGCGVGSPQETWLRADLAANPSTCTLAYWHRPRFSSNANQISNADYDAFWRDLYAAGADLILNGHAHNYERFAPQNPAQQLDTNNGIRQIVVGTGGEDFGTMSSSPQPNSEVRASKTFGVLLLELHPSSYSWRFLPEPGGTFTDSGTTACH